MNFYQIIGVSKTATPGEIKKAYFTHCRESHPDKLFGDPNRATKEAKFKEITNAYDVLGDPDKRTEYDRWLNIGNFSQPFRYYAPPPPPPPKAIPDVMVNLHIGGKFSEFYNKNEYRFDYKVEGKSCFHISSKKIYYCPFEDSPTKRWTYDSVKKDLNGRPYTLNQTYSYSLDMQGWHFSRFEMGYNDGCFIYPLRITLKKALTTVSFYVPSLVGSGEDTIFFNFLNGERLFKMDNITVINHFQKVISLPRLIKVHVDINPLEVKELEKALGGLSLFNIHPLDPMGVGSTVVKKALPAVSKQDEEDILYHKAHKDPPSGSPLGSDSEKDSDEDSKGKKHKYKKTTTSSSSNYSTAGSSSQAKPAKKFGKYMEDEFEDLQHIRNLPRDEAISYMDKNWRVADLRKYCSLMKIRGISKLLKAALIEVVVDDIQKD